jgi:hypothetical protein
MNHLAKTPTATIGKLRTIFWVSAAVLGLMLASALVGKQSTPAKEVPARVEYAGVWREGTHPGISQALRQRGIRMCGEYYWRESTITPGQYMLFCTFSGATWSAYLVWDKSGDVMGPFDTPQDLPLPRK